MRKSDGKFVAWLFDGCDAVHVGGGRIDFDASDDGYATVPVHVDHAREQHVTLVDEVIAKEHRERLTAETYWIAGLSTTGSISFGIALVVGRNRVRDPLRG